MAASTKPRSIGDTKKPKNIPQKQGIKSRGKQKERSFFSSRNATLFLCFLGICVCVFSLYIEILKEKNPNYVALCDINSYISCSKVLTSRYGKGFGIIDRMFPKDSILNQPNPVFGLAFYMLEATLALKMTAPTALIQLVFAILANLGSVYLAYILFYILQDLCLICISTYVINFLILVANFYSLKSAVTNEMKMQSKKKK